MLDFLGLVFGDMRMHTLAAAEIQRAKYLVFKLETPKLEDLPSIGPEAWWFFTNYNADVCSNIAQGIQCIAAVVTAGHQCGS